MLLPSTKWNGNFGKTNLASSFSHIMYRNWGRVGRIGWGTIHTKDLNVYGSYMVRIHLERTQVIL